MTIDGIAQYLRENDRYVIVTHDSPDADGLGAAYALAIVLKALGKTALPVVTGPIPSRIRFIDQRGIVVELDACKPSLPFPLAEARPIIVDTHDLGYLGECSSSIVKAAGFALGIDHHERKGKASELELIDSRASSSCEIIFDIARSLGASLPEDAAEAIFAGIVYDTGSFVYPKTGVRTFECARELAKIGVQPYEVHRRMYESASKGVLLLQKSVIASLELFLEGRVAMQSLSKETLAASGALYEDAEEFVNFPLQDRLVEVSALFKENYEGRLRCSLRSKGLVNVALIAQAFGGGGHKTAAGFTCASPLARSKADVLQSIARDFVP